jgi:hypothetical protein
MSKSGRTASDLPASMKLKAPCKDCPFRKDRDFLVRRRKIDLTFDLGFQGQSFSCHKTLDYSGDRGTFIEGISNHCAGAMLYLDNIKASNSVMQIGTRLGLWSIDDLTGRELVHDSIASFTGDPAVATMDDVNEREGSYGGHRRSQRRG